jgi:hypothetical protein
MKFDLPRIVVDCILYLLFFYWGYLSGKKRKQ